MHAGFLEAMSVTSVCLQAFVVLLAMISYGFVEDKFAWRWFVAASLMVFIRRLTGMFEALLGSNTDDIEAIETVLISMMWILFMFIKTNGFKKIK